MEENLVRLGLGLKLRSISNGTAGSKGLQDRTPSTAVLPFPVLIEPFSFSSIVLPLHSVLVSPSALVVYMHIVYVSDPVHAMYREPTCFTCDQRLFSGAIAASQFAE